MPGPQSRQEVFVAAVVLTGDIAGSQTFHFSPKEAPAVNLQLGLDVRPYLLSFSGRQTRIDPDKALTQRARVTLRLADDDAPPDFDSTVFTTFKGGSFWRRFVVAQPDFIGSAIEVRRGALPLTTFGAMALIFKGRVESIDFANDGSVSLVAKDVLALQDRLVPAKISDSNLLNGGIGAQASPITVDDASEVTDPATLPSKDLFPITIRLQPDSIPFTLAGASWTATTRLIVEANAFVGYTFVEGDQIFLVHASITNRLYKIAGKVSDSSIVMEESIFASDLTSVLSRAAEDVIIRKVDTALDELTVQENFATKTEDFSDSTWVKSGVTVTPNAAAGPFGTARADLLAFASAGDFIEQDTGELAAGIAWDGSVWLKRSLNATADGPITIIIRNPGATSAFSLQVTVTENWQRFDVSGVLLNGVETVVFRIQRGGFDEAEVLAFGVSVVKGTARSFYAARNGGGSGGASAGRGAFGSTAIAHDDDTPFAEVLVYRQFLNPEDGVHVVVALRDLVNRGEIALADVDQSSFDTEFNFIGDSLVKRAGRIAITEPKRLKEHVKAVSQQGMLDLWVSETGKVTTRFNFRQTLPGATVQSFTHEANVLFRALSVRNNAESRITRIFVFFDPKISDAKDDPTQYNSSVVKANLPVEAASGTKARRIFADWLFRQGDAVALAGRLLGRFVRGARLLSVQLDMSDEPDFTVGDVIAVDTPDVLSVGTSGSTVRKAVLWQVTQRSHRRSDGRVAVEALETSGLKYAIISPDEDLETSPDPFPDFVDASDAERQYAFIGDANNELTDTGGEKVEGYFIL
jgi:hypothetical protein